MYFQELFSLQTAAGNLCSPHPWNARLAVGDPHDLPSGDRLTEP